MKTLDLHGNKHNDVDRVVENFTLLEEFPHKIITADNCLPFDLRKIIYPAVFYALNAPF